MTATNAAPDRHPDTAEERWQRIQDKITDLERRIREISSAAITAIDTRLAHLDALRRRLAQHPWPPPAPADAAARQRDHSADRSSIPTDAASLQRVPAFPANGLAGAPPVGRVLV
ncbi:hypothetical protein [Streptomyces sp. NRRL B-24484]|uniref:hypothetical protein n=1 Tax=Streptomyces sp. NRRL B-24484 TaxID=1463833 RepID=UPI0004C05121|nr:hypothetical protein [Streptomyces sp. NRRL B-24484]